MVSQASLIAHPVIGMLGGKEDLEDHKQKNEAYADRRHNRPFHS